MLPASTLKSSPESQPLVDGSAQITRMVFLGDSLTAGFGLRRDEAFPERIADSLAARGEAVQIINAGVSGDTSAGGLSRINWILQQRPDFVAVCLGANDGLRGLSTKGTAQNLTAILQRIIQSEATPILIGMKLPPNLGPDYVTEFEAIYPELAAQFDIPFVPYLLEGVGGVPELNQNDGIHPTAKGHEMIAGNLLPLISDVLAQHVSE